ncbi:MAG: hypothetical protein ACE5HT_08995 [Gemmatimonadales bacterium]
MTDPQLLVPLRVPELGPYLGKLVSGVERYSGWIALDSARYKLATRVIECAGTARRLAANDERASALAAVGRLHWQEAWEEAVNNVADMLLGHASRVLDAEADAVRMPRRIRKRFGPSGTERRSLIGRLGREGAGLVAALDKLELAGAELLGATGLEREALDRWQDHLKLVARRLEEVWTALEEAVGREEARWRQQAELVSRWRKATWPVVVVGTLALSLAIWLGLVFGGYVPAPKWFSDVWGALFPQ